MLERMRRKGNPFALFQETGTDTMENGMEIPQEIKNSHMKLRNPI